jgi:hypothetical protein
MAKSDKSTVVRRTQEILRLILAGGEFEGIRQYAAAQGWNLSDRQLRRYQDRAHQRVLEATNRDQRQLLGRHLMQRRALYARALKTSDVRTALHVLRDEAVLEGLYPSARSGERDPLREPPPPLSRAERFKRALAAEHQEEEKELALMEHLTPKYYYRLPDTMIPLQMLHTIALMHVALQLDHAAMFLAALWQISQHGDANGTWDLVGACHAFQFKVGTDAWNLFAEELGVDGDWLIAVNHRGSMLELFGGHIYDMAPTEEDMKALLAKHGEASDRLIGPKDLVREWRDLFGQVLRE